MFATCLLASPHLLWPSVSHLHNGDNHLRSVCFLGLLQNLWKKWYLAMSQKLTSPLCPCGLSPAHQSAAFLPILGFQPSNAWAIWSSMDWWPADASRWGKGGDGFSCYLACITHHPRLKPRKQSLSSALTHYFFNWAEWPCKKQIWSRHLPT